MSTSSTNSDPDPVADHAEVIIKYLLGFDFPASAFDHLQPAPHQLSAEAIALRVVAMKGRSYNATAAVVTEILTELELHRLGFDLGFEAGFEAGQAVR